MDAEIIEADFQQYYHIDVEGERIVQKRFRRFCRLLLNLPFESRFIQKYSPTKDWDWDKEVQSQILHVLDVITCQLANMMKKEGRAPAKPQPQLQPEYVKKAKAEVETNRKETEHMSVKDYDEMKEFWQAYNCDVKGSKKNDN